MGVSFFSEILSSLLDRTPGLARRVNDDNQPLESLCAELLSSRGDVSGMSLAQLILDRYAGLDKDGKLNFLIHLATDMDVRADKATQALHTYQQAPTAENYEVLTAMVEPSRLQLIRRLNQTHDATAKLVAMRQDLIGFLKTAPELAKLDIDFKHLFGSWFNRGFLVLRPINWSSPAHILEKIITYESVHEIQSWDDLRRRLQPEDRRCFAFFHPAMPDEPLIFVEVALTKGTPNSVQNILREDRVAISADSADTAAFYSISNCQSGLAGISFGNSLIKTVVQHLLRELPQINNFVTLSPIPGMMKWLNSIGYADKVVDAESQIRLAAHYLLNVKHKNGQPLDPVARFHLNNGALIDAVHANADTSAKGMAQSCGVMVNYLYDLDRISENHEAFANQNTVVSKKTIRTLAAELSLDDPS
jgi:malonyl-CoA decarboxylase